MKYNNTLSKIKCIFILTIYFLMILQKTHGEYIIALLETLNKEREFKKLKTVNSTLFVNLLNKYKNLRKPKYIIFIDNLYNIYCSDINAYTVFEYYMKNNLSDAYYIINKYSNLYQTLLSQNKTKNLILFENKTYYNNIFEYYLNSKLIVTSYGLNNFLIIRNVPYLKILYINHGITYFKSSFMNRELKYIEEKNRNIITSSPFEYSILLNKFNYSKSYIYKAGLARYDMFNSKKIDNNRKCILVFFTFRKYNNTVFEKSLYKHNIENFINDENLIKYISNNFSISEILKKQYNSIFYYRYNITERIHQIISKIIR